MKPVDESGKGEGRQQECALDEAFFLRVDRAVLMSKQTDPYRLGETQRAAAEESRLANMVDFYGLERRRLRDTGQG
ncbi:hypothetical protein [Variovorax sp. tm]|uniref:hypothetical protein n=1 Tax=Variovorax atrisoli TaxID=3394203 RepID=UPI003A801D9D